MHITVIGTGYVGLVTAACLSDFGHTVVGVDKDHNKINALKNGRIPIYEPGLDDIVQRNVQAGRLRFTTDITEEFDRTQVVFIAVGTPPQEDGSADLQHVEAVAREIAPSSTTTKSSSTNPPSPSAPRPRPQVIAAHQTQKVPFDVVSNPEFLRKAAPSATLCAPTGSSSAPSPTAPVRL